MHFLPSVPTAANGFVAVSDVCTSTFSLPKCSLPLLNVTSLAGLPPAFAPFSDNRYLCTTCRNRARTSTTLRVQQCLDIWIKSHTSCPYCKGDLNLLPTGCEASIMSPRANARRVIRVVNALVSWPYVWGREQWLQARSRTAEGGVSSRASATSPSVTSPTVELA